MTGRQEVAAKSELRDRLRRARRSLSDDDRRAASAAIAAHLEAFAPWRAAGTVAVYVATRSEVHTLALRRAPGKRVVLPRVEALGRPLSWHEDVGDLERAGAIRQPRASAPRVAPSAIDLVVLPAVGVDPAGHRLGQGGGFYDRTLARMPRTVRVAVVYACQVVDAIPVDAHDLPVHAFVTERGVRVVDPVWTRGGPG